MTLCDSAAPLTERFAEAMALLGVRLSSRIAVAVSGGGDSLALAALTQNWLGQVALPGQKSPFVMAAAYKQQADQYIQHLRAEQERG